jgi:hypothetical protein
MCTAWQWRTICIILDKVNSSVYLVMISAILQYLKIMAVWAVWYKFTILEKSVASIFTIP